MIRVGLIGCGHRGPGAALNAMDADPGVRLVAMTDIFPDHVPSRRKAQEAHAGPGAGGRRPLFFRPGRLPARDRQRRRGAGGLRGEIPPRLSPAGRRGGQARFRREAARHRSGGRPPDLGRLRVGQAEGVERDVRPAQPARPGYQETVKRVHDGAIGDIVAIEENFIRSPYNIGPPRSEAQ